MTQAQITAAANAAIAKYSNKKLTYQGGYAGQCVSLAKQFITDLTGKVAPATGTGSAEGWLSRPGGMAALFNAAEAYDPNRDYPAGTLVFNKATHHVAIYLNRQGAGARVLEQNADPDGSPVHLAVRPANKLSHVLTWKVSAPAPSPSAGGGEVGKTIHLPQDSGDWHLYHEDGPYGSAAIKSGNYITVLHPAAANGGYSYKIVADHGNGVFIVVSPRWGRGALNTNGSKFSIS